MRARLDPSQLTHATRVALVAALASTALTVSCDGTTSALGPDGAELVATTGGAFTVGGLSGASLVGSWTRVDAPSPGVLVETTFTFLQDGRGARSVVTRTALGAVIAEGTEPFAWSGGAGVLLLRFSGPLGDTLLRASFAIQTEVTGTLLRLDGRTYRRGS